MVDVRMPMMSLPDEILIKIFSFNHNSNHANVVFNKKFINYANDVKIFNKKSQKLAAQFKNGFIVIENQANLDYEIGYSFGDIITNTRFFKKYEDAARYLGRLFKTKLLEWSSINELEFNKKEMIRRKFLRKLSSIQRFIKSFEDFEIRLNKTFKKITIEMKYDEDTVNILHLVIL